MRRNAKQGAGMSRLREAVEGIGREGCSKRKAELIEKHLDRVEESLEEVTKLYNDAVEAMPWEEQRDARRACDLLYNSSDE